MLLFLECDCLCDGFVDSRWLQHLGLFYYSHVFKKVAIAFQHVPFGAAFDRHYCEARRLEMWLVSGCLPAGKDLDLLPAPLSPSTQRQWKLQRERLTNDFTTALGSFQVRSQHHSLPAADQPASPHSLGCLPDSASKALNSHQTWKRSKFCGGMRECT